MDIWKWVWDLERDLREAGNGRLADLIDSIPSDSDANRPELVAAAMPEALAGARALNNRWLEVYFRHWGLNNRMGDLAEGEKALPEVVSLVEFAHREETQSCPQSVCATQDIAMCYGNIDGPGWVPERLAVCEETLARINPEWPCFECISLEYAEALLDAGRGKDTLVFLERQMQALRDVGDEPTEQLHRCLVRALRLEGQAAAALAKLDAIENKEGRETSDSGKNSTAILRATLLAETRDFDAAWEVLPNWNDLQPSVYAAWSRALHLIALAQPAHNVWQVGRLLQKSMLYLSSVGSHRYTVEIALRHAELALARQALWTAQGALKLAQTQVQKLRNPQDLAPAVAALTVRLETQNSSENKLPVPAAELAAYLRTQEGSSPERDVQWLLQASQQLPQDADLASFTASALGACGASEDAKNHLWQFVRTNPATDGPNYQLLHQLIEAQDFAGITQLAAMVAAENPLMALWCKAQQAFAQKDWAQACQHLQAYVDANPESKGAMHFWALAALAQQDLSTALRLRKALAAQCQPDTAEHQNCHWNLITVASAAQDWATVRNACKALNIELEADTSEAGDAAAVVEERWGGAVIEFMHKNQPQRRFALRTGPTTARILTHANAPEPQYLGDWVAFDAEPLEAPPQDEAERANFTPTYRAVHTIEAGGFGGSCFVDGAFPGEVAFAQFEANLQAKGWVLRVTSPEDYTVTNPNASGAEDAMLAGCYFQVAAPQNCTPQEVDAVLKELTAAWQHPVCWQRYASRAGLAVELHMDIVARYGL